MQQRAGQARCTRGPIREIYVRTPFPHGCFDRNGVLSAQIYVVARLAHYVIYVAGIPVVRTLAFLAGACATLAIAMALLDSAT
jgi:hypothetical protein